MNTSVLVVGAGPVGLTMAAELARYGVSVRIVEKAAQRTDKSKAIVMWSLPHLPFGTVFTIIFATCTIFIFTL
jgi:thioredoxin reductase